MGWKKHPPSGDDGLEGFAPGCITWPVVAVAVTVALVTVRWI